MYNKDKSKYDEFGVLKTIPWNKDIVRGDLVEYIDTKSNNRKKIKVPLKGTWDGEKVCFDDNEKTVVRTTRWLKKIKNENR